ncbi:hypothetical protein OAT16_00065 [Prolixibacteraceae bacterium]|nr:hypothetical protein [Prolixibacteraceae bacterium]
MLETTYKNMVNNRFTNVDIFEEHIVSSNILFHSFKKPDNQIDGIIEVIKKEETVNIQYGIKIYEIDEQKQDHSKVVVDITEDYVYFNSFELPLFIIVLSNISEEGYWLDITKLKGSLSSEIVIQKNDRNKYNKTTSSNILVDYLMNKRFKFIEITEQLNTPYYNNLRSLLQDMFGIIDIAIPIILKYDNLESIISKEKFTLHLSKASDNSFADVMNILQSKEYLDAETLPPISKTQSTINLQGGTPFYFKTRSNHIFMTDINFEYYKESYRVFKLRFD